MCRKRRLEGGLSVCLAMCYQSDARWLAHTRGISKASGAEFMPWERSCAMAPRMALRPKARDPAASVESLATNCWA